MIPLNEFIKILKKKSARIKKSIKDINVKDISVKHDNSKLIELSENISRDLLSLNSIEYRCTTTKVVNVDNMLIYNEYIPLDYARLSMALDYNKYHMLITIKAFRTGGTDKLLMRYLEGIKHTLPEFKILVLVIEGSKCEWDALLPSNVSLIYLKSYMLQNFSNSLYSQILKRLIVQYDFNILWNFNCRETYIFTEEFRGFLKSVNLSVWGLVFAHWLKPNNLQEFGMVHENLPFVIDDYSVVISDNLTFTQYVCHQYDWANSKFRTLYVPNSDKDIEFYDRGNGSSLRVLWASGIEWNKGVDTLIEISKSIKNLPIALDIYGGTKNKDGENLLIKLNANIWGSKNVSYKGEFSKFSDIVNMENYDCFLFTSIVEGMPNVIIEAAENQLSIVTPIVGGVGEFLHNDNSYIVNDKKNSDEYVEKLKEVLLDKITNNKTKQFNLIKSYNEKFTISKFRSQFLDLLGDDLGFLDLGNDGGTLELIKIDRKVMNEKKYFSKYSEKNLRDGKTLNKISRIKPLLRKLKNNPYSFFNDSKNPKLRKLRVLFE